MKVLRALKQIPLLGMSSTLSMSDSTGKVSGALVTKPFQTWQKKSAKFVNHEKTSYPPVLSSIGRGASAFCGTSRQTFQNSQGKS
eukprot:Em0014g468a